MGFMGEANRIFDKGNIDKMVAKEIKGENSYINEP